MGLLDRLAFSLGLRKREANVLVVGLDNAGKSTVLNHFRPEEQRASEMVPTVGYSVEKFKGADFIMQITNYNFTLFNYLAYCTEHIILIIFYWSSGFHEIAIFCTISIASDLIII